MESRTRPERITNENMWHGCKNAGFGHGWTTGKCRGACESEISAINRSSRLAMVEIEQTAESLPFFDLARLVRGFGAGKGDDVVDPLVRSFRMVVRDVFVKDVFQRWLPKQDHLVQAFAFDGADPALGKGVQIRAARRQDHRFDPNGLEDFVKSGRVFSVPIMNEILGPCHGRVRSRHVAGDLLDPSVGRVWRDAAENDSAGLQMNEEENVVGGEAIGGPDLGGN